MRAFIAFEIEDEIKEYLDQLVEEMKTICEGVRWVKRENHHVTIKFFENIGEEKAEVVKKMLSQIGEIYKPFLVRTDGVKFFPDRKRARVIVLGFKEGQDKMEQIFLDIERRLSTIGIEKEKRKFTPHITLGRAKIPSAFREVEPLSLVEKVFSVEKIIFFKSTLLPHGPVYTPIYEISLKKDEKNGLKT